MTRLEEIKTVAYEKDRELCSSYQSFVLGAVWADEHPCQGLVDINNVCDYLDRLLYYDEHDGMLKCNFTSFDEFIEDFRKAMED